MWVWLFLHLASMCTDVGSTACVGREWNMLTWSPHHLPLHPHLPPNLLPLQPPPPPTSNLLPLQPQTSSPSNLKPPPPSTSNLLPLQLQTSSPSILPNLPPYLLLPFPTGQAVWRDMCVCWPHQSCEQLSAMHSNTPSHPSCLECVAATGGHSSGPCPA